MVERRLPKPKVAGSNPVFRSKETPPEPKTAAHRQRSFLFRLRHRSGKRGSPQDLLLPPVEGRGGYKKARNTRADFESLRTKNQCEFEPRFPLNKVSKGLPTAAPEQKTTLTDIPNKNKIPHLPKVCIFPAISPHLPKVSFRTMSTRASVAAFCLHSAFPHLPKVSRNTRKSTHLPKVEQQQSHRLRIFRYCPQDFVPLQHYGRQLSRKKIRRIPGTEGRSRESEAYSLEEAAGRLPEANDGR